MTFNTKKYNAVRKQVLKYLDKNPENGQSIVLQGKQGVGKSRILNELLSDFENSGYECINTPLSPTRVTRSIASKKVFAWDETDGSVDLKKDTRFVVFTF